MWGLPAGHLRIRARCNCLLPGSKRRKAGTHHRTSSGRIRAEMNASSATPIRAIDVIRKKRDGGELSRAEIEALVGGYTRDEIPDYQASAWLMAALIKGLTRAETAALTDTMLRSGEVLDFSDLPSRKVDKHSTGGVGDKTSLVLAPLAAAGGLIVPIISGWGLGHTRGPPPKTGGIPGFDFNFPIAGLSEGLRNWWC